MSNWRPRTNRSGLQYGGAAHNYYWNPSYNPNATYNNCMANCTTFAYGRQLEEGVAPPVTNIINAGNWHTVLTNGWTAQPYSSYRGQIKPGDIIEWPGHVAVVENIVNGIPYCSSSLYTGDHGRAEWPPNSGNWDTRSPSVMGSTLQSVCNWMLTHYAWRFYEYVSADVITNTRLGVQPTYVLVNPMSPGPEPPGPEPEPGIDLPLWMLIALKRKKKVRIV